MGYTHYSYQNRDLTEDEWRAFTSGFERLLGLPTTPPLCRYDEEHPTPPEVTDEVVCFNGVGDDGHETCVVHRYKTDWITGERSTKDEQFSFTKTAYKPYDVVVTAVYAYLDSSFGDAFRISSDGEYDDWIKGVALAREAWPEVSIDVPREVREPALD